MTTTKNPKDVVLVNCHEVPETIYVETRFITHSASKQKKYDQLYYITATGNFELIRPEDQVPIAKSFIQVSKPITYGLQANLTSAPVATIQQCQLPQQAQPPDTMVPIATALTNLNKNSSCFSNLSAIQSINSAPAMPLSNTSPLQTLNLNTSVLPPNTLGNSNTLNIPNVTRPFTNKIQQSDVSALNKKSVAVQCKLDEELEDTDVEWPEISQDCIESPTNLETEKEDFFKYIAENSTQHHNYKECLICGELCKSNKYFYGHMAIHRGPRVLCYKCGQCLDHKNLFLKHKCRKARQLEIAFLQCPHHNCSVKAISPLELFDHINEHANNRMYKCSSCHKGFCTGQEFLRHLLIRAKCYTSPKRKRFRVYGLESYRDRSCRVRVFTLHTFKKCTTLVKTFLSKRVAKRGLCGICLRPFPNKSVYNRHRLMCITKFRKRLIRKKLK